MTDQGFTDHDQSNVRMHTTCALLTSQKNTNILEGSDPENQYRSYLVSKKFIILCTVALGITGCSQMPGLSQGPAEPTAATAPSKVRDGMNARGDVTDPSKITCGDGPKVKGINDTDGEILGKSAPGSKFDRVKIGMGMKQVTDLVGQPTDQGAYTTGKAFIPFYFGGDRHRFEMAYKGWGRLIFAGGGLGNMSGGNLVCVINYAADTGYR